MNKNLKITILGKSYYIATNENIDDILQAAELVDKLMREKIEKSKITNDSKIAIITALQLATDLTKSTRYIETYEKQASNLVSLLNAQ